MTHQLVAWQEKLLIVDQALRNQRCSLYRHASIPWACEWQWHEDMQWNPRGRLRGSDKQVGDDDRLRLDELGLCDEFDQCTGLRGLVFLVINLENARKGRL